MLIAAYNEEAVIRRTVERILRSDYPVEQILVVDDGSQDRTAEIVGDLAAAEPKVGLVRQENHGKWSALNRGLTELTSEIVVTSDADTVFIRTL